MTVFHNAKQDSPITAVEFSPVSDGNFTFISIDSPISVKGVKDWLRSKDIDQEIIAETQVDGHPVLVTHGDTEETALLDKLKSRGEQMFRYERKKEFSEKVWPMGATIAIIGQSMQLTSSFLRPNREADWNLRMLAIPNLLASAWIFFYGAERSKDTHRLTYLKRHFNEELGQHVPGGQESLPDIHDERLRFHRDDEDEKGLKAKLNGFLERNSVTLGEIGLRYAGAMGLAFNSKKWGGGLQRLLKGEFKEAYEFSRTRTPIPGTSNVSNLTHYAGLSSLTGKTISILSKAPDPYNPKPPTWLDKVREKFTFNFGGALETLAFGTVAYEGFKNKQISFRKGGPVHRDYISGIGGSLFTIRYIMRNWAPFGVRDMNMPELYAHVTDSLAKMPPDQLPQLLADTAADLTNHFKDKHLKYGEVFTELLIDLYRYHHIALDNLGTEPEERMKKNGQHPHARQPATQPVTAKQTLRTGKHMRTEPGSHAEKLARSQLAAADTELSR